MVLHRVKEHQIPMPHWNLEAILWEYKVIQHYILVCICSRPTQQSVEEVSISVDMTPVLKPNTKLCEDSATKSGQIVLLDSLGKLLELWEVPAHGLSSLVDLLSEGNNEVGDEFGNGRSHIGFE